MLLKVLDDTLSVMINILGGTDLCCQLTGSGTLMSTLMSTLIGSGYAYEVCSRLVSKSPKKDLLALSYLKVTLYALSSPEQMRGWNVHA